MKLKLKIKTRSGSAGTAKPNRVVQDSSRHQISTTSRTCFHLAVANSELSQFRGEHRVLSTSLNQATSICVHRQDSFTAFAVVNGCRRISDANPGDVVRLVTPRLTSLIPIKPKVPQSSTDYPFGGDSDTRCPVEHLSFLRR